MQKTKSRSRHNNHDLYGDLAKIKGALYDAVHHAKGRAGDTLSQYWDETKERSANLQENVSNFTAEKPLKTIGITLLTGVLIGYFIHK
jgi:ElaB/YqjD/DUF883 family membrane-anchored ribosome-binding protein